MANKINSTLMTGASRIKEALLGNVEKLIDDNFNAILVSLGKAAMDIGEGSSGSITLKIGTPLTFTGTKVYMEPTIEWERKNKSKYDGKPVNVELTQTELEFN